MNNLGDIENNGAINGAINDPLRQGGSQNSSTSALSKSKKSKAGMVLISVDASFLDLIAANDDDEDVEYLEDSDDSDGSDFSEGSDGRHQDLVFASSIHLSDIEEEGDNEGSFRLGGTQHSRRTESRENRKSKSSRSFIVGLDGSMRSRGTVGSVDSVLFSVDRSVLELLDADDDDESSEGSDKQHRDPLFGRCCDLVRTVIVVDTLFLMMSIIMMIMTLLGLSVIDPDIYDLRWYDDDQIEATVNLLDRIFWILIIKTICGAIFSSIGIYGATTFNKNLVLSAMIFCCIDTLWSLMFFKWIYAGICLFFVYPHVALFRALKNGKLTSKNYHDMKHCCCACTFSCCARYTKEKRITEPKESRDSSGTPTDKVCDGSCGSKDCRRPPTENPGAVKSVPVKSA